MSNQAKRLSDCPAERLAQCRGNLVPPAGGDLEVLAWRVLGYNFNTEAFALDYAKWAEDIEPVRYLVDRAHAIRLQAEVSALQQLLNIADQRVCDLEHASAQGLEVNPTSLRAVLTALVAAPHEIRELQACRGIPDNPIDQLLREYNDWVYAPDPPAAKLDASMIGIVHTPPMEYDEP